MEAFGFNGVVGRKVQENFFNPVEIHELMKPLVERFGGTKKKWRVYVAALLALAEHDEAEISRRVGVVAAADAMETFGLLAEQILARGEPLMLEHDDIDAPTPDAEPVKRRVPQRTTRSGKSGRRTGTPLPRARATAVPAEPAR